MDKRTKLLQHAVPMGILANKRILITRAQEQAGETENEVLRRDAIPVLFPCLAVRCLKDDILQGVHLLETDAVSALFTSSNGVRCVADTLAENMASAFHGKSVAAIGNKTAALLNEYGVSAQLVAETPSQEGLMDAFEEQGLPETLAFFRAEEGRDWLANALREKGVNVHVIAAYRTICPDDDASDIVHALQQGEISAVLLGSAKTARHYVQRISDAALAGRPVVAVISAHVAQEAASLDLNVQVVAKQASFASMLNGLEEYFARHRP